MSGDYVSLQGGRAGPSARSVALMGERVAQGFCHRSADVRKNCARELEQLVKANDGFVFACANIFAGEYLASADAQMRKGGLLGLATLALSFDEVNEALCGLALKAILSCADDRDARVRYYVCESLYNLLRRFPSLREISMLDLLRDFAVDANAEVRRASTFLDQVLWEAASTLGQLQATLEFFAGRAKTDATCAHTDLSWISRIAKTIRIPDQHVVVFVNWFSRNADVETNQTLLDLQKSMQELKASPDLYCALFAAVEQRQNVKLARSAMYCIAQTCKHEIPASVVQQLVLVALQGLDLYPSLNEQLLEKFEKFVPTSAIAEIKAALLAISVNDKNEKGCIRWCSILSKFPDIDLIEFVLDIFVNSADVKVRTMCWEIARIIGTSDVALMVGALAKFKDEIWLKTNLSWFRELVTIGDFDSLLKAESPDVVFFVTLALFVLDEFAPIRADFAKDGESQELSELARRDSCARFLVSVFLGNGDEAEAALRATPGNESRWKIVTRALLTKAFVPRWCKVCKCKRALTALCLLVSDCEEQRALARKLDLKSLIS